MNPDWRLALANPALREHEVHVYYCAFERPIYNRDLANLLSAEECERAEQFKVEQGKRAYVVSHAFLRSVLGRYLNVPPTGISFGKGERGKPYLRALEHQSSLQCSLSRCHSGAVCAVALNAAVGIDLEWPNPDLCDDFTAQQVFTLSELSQLRALEGEQRVHAFYRCWTRKEAYAKWTGVGLSAELKTIYLGLEDVASTVGQCYLATFPCPGGEVASLAVSDSLKDVAFWKFPITD